MIDLSKKYFMMIEPDKQGEKSQHPIVDELTRMVDYIFSKCKESDYCYKGFHMTKCGRVSDNNDWILPNGMITNSLCTYYIRFYRDFIPKTEIEKIVSIYDNLQTGDMSPNTYVYCTNCVHLVYGKDDIPRCKFEDRCDIWDHDDSRPFKERPYYETNLKLKKYNYPGQLTKK